MKTRAIAALLLTVSCCVVLAAERAPNGRGNYMLNGSCAVTATTSLSYSTMVFAGALSLASFVSRGFALGLDLGLGGGQAHGTSSALVVTACPKFVVMPGGANWPVYPMTSVGGQVAVATMSGGSGGWGWAGVELTAGVIPMVGRRLGVPLIVTIYPRYFGGGAATMLKFGLTAFRY